MSTEIELQTNFDEDHAAVQRLRKEVEDDYRKWCESTRRLEIAEQRMRRSFEARLDHIAQPPVITKCAPAIMTDVDDLARLIYEAEPFEEGGEYVDGFQVSPGGALTWEQACARDAEFADSAEKSRQSGFVSVTKSAHDLASRILEAGWRKAHAPPSGATKLEEISRIIATTCCNKMCTMQDPLCSCRMAAREVLALVAVGDSAQAVCDAYAEENQRLSDERDAAHDELKRIRSGD